MKLLVFGKPALRQDLPAFEQLISRGRRSGWQIEQRSTTSREDVALMELYDIVQTPAFVTIHTDGALGQLWQHNVPAYDDIAAHFLT